MTRTEERLADALQAVARSVRPETLPPLDDNPARIARPAARRTRWLAPVAAATAVTVIAIVASALFTRTSRTGTGRAASPPPPYPYYVTIDPNPGPGHAVVRSTATGAVTATVPTPAQTNPRNVAAAAGLSFFVTFQPALNAAKDVAERIYRFQVTRSGRISGLAPVPGGTLTGFASSAMAVTPDGSRLAVAVTPNPTTCASQLAPSRIFVINTRTGARTVWQGGTATPGTNSFAIDGLSWTADGRELAYLAEWTDVQLLGKPSGPMCDSSSGGPAQEEVRGLITAGHGGRLNSGPLLLRRAGTNLRELAAAIITPDGSAITAVVTSYTAPRFSTFVVRISAITGKQLSVLYRVGLLGPVPVRYISSDPSGRYLLLSVGERNITRNGWIDNGRLLPLKPAGSVISLGAW
jgi:hypothetical protein